MKETFNTNKKANLQSQMKESTSNIGGRKEKNLYLTDILRKILKVLFTKKKKKWHSMKYQEKKRWNAKFPLKIRNTEKMIELRKSCRT